MWVILQCTDVSQAAEHSFSQVCDLIVTQVETLQETEARKHPILQTTQVIERQIPGDETHTHALPESQPTIKYNTSMEKKTDYAFLERNVHANFIVLYIGWNFKVKAEVTHSSSRRWQNSQASARMSPILFWFTRRILSMCRPYSQPLFSSVRLLYSNSLAEDRTHITYKSLFWFVWNRNFN